MKKLAALILLAGVGLAGTAAHVAVQNDRDYQRLIRQGDEALSRGQTYVAIDAFGGAIALKRGSMLAYLKRGEALHHRGDSPETLTAALRDFRKAADLDPGAPRVQEELGDVNFQLHRYANAAESYEAYLRLDDSPSVFYKLALAERGQGQTSNAITTLQKAIRLNPSFAEAHYLLGLCMKDRGQLRDAQESFERAIAISPVLIPAREELADLHRLQAQTREEIEQLEALAALDPTRAQRLVAMGLAYSRAGNPEMAVTALGRAAERFHDYPPAYAALGEVWLETAEDRGDNAALRKALEALEPVASQPTASSEILGLYGRALALNGQTEQAERAFRMAGDTFPTDATVLPQYASIAQRLGHLADARQALQRYAMLVDDDHDQAAHASQIADLSLQLNDPVSALTWYEKSASLAPPDAGLLAHLADAQLQAGQLDAARATIARATAKNPANASVRAAALRIQHVAEAVPQEIKP